MLHKPLRRLFFKNHLKISDGVKNIIYYPLLIGLCGSKHFILRGTLTLTEGTKGSPNYITQFQMYAGVIR